MKLVELLASGVSEWHDRTERLHQDGDGRIYATCRKMPKFHKEWNEWDVSGHEVIMNGEDPIYGDCLDLADDYKANVVTRAQWQAERDKQKGGEWKRHRAGRKQPVPDRIKIEVKFRDGEVHTVMSDRVDWIHYGRGSDLMQYRIISQPQAEEPMKAKFDGVKLEFSRDGVNFSEIGTARIDNICDLGPAEPQWQQSSGPLAWRDTIIHCQAIIEDCEREIQANVNLLDSEGLFMQLEPKKGMQAYDVRTDVDLSDYRNWVVGSTVVVGGNFGSYGKDHFESGAKVTDVDFEDSECPLEINGLWFTRSEVLSDVTHA